MRILKLLNSKNFSILCIFFTLFFQNIFADDTVDIWKLKKKSNENKTETKEIFENENDSFESIFDDNTNNKKILEINEEENIASKKINIVGIYDPSFFNLSIKMWVNSNGSKILEIMNKIKKTDLSKDATDILNMALLTNSYLPERNITKEEFLKIKSDWLIKQQNLDLIEIYLNKNKNLENKSALIKYYFEYYLSRSNLSKACEIFNVINTAISDDYISKFHIYCLIDLNKADEAQLQFDLLKEIGFEDKFFEKKFNYLMGYDSDIDAEVSENSLLDFHLSHRTNPDFIFEPKINTSKLIWKYLSSSNLLENADIIDIENTDKLFAIEKATHDKNYDENELFTIYERFMFNINQLLTVKDAYKSLSNSEARALLYQGILLNKETSEKIQLIKLLKNSFIQDKIPNAFDIKLTKFLKEMNIEEIPSDYQSFFQFYSKSNISEKKIKFNNKIVHQSKLLNYFIEDSSEQKIEKDLENLLKKIKKDKKYFFSIKDIILLETLKVEGVKFPKKYENIYEEVDPNIPYDIQILINKEERGLFLLRLVEIIGEDNIVDIDIETMYFIISALNQLGIDKLRDQILLKVLPLKV